MNSLGVSCAAWVASYAVNSLWLAPLAAGAGWLAARLLAKVGPGAQHRAWVAAFFLAVLLPGCALLPRPLDGAALHAPAGSAAVRILAAVGSPAVVTTVPGALLMTILLAYGCTVGYFLARFAWSVAATAALVRNSRSVPLTERDREIWRRSRSVSGFRARYCFAPRRSAGRSRRAYAFPL